MTIFVICVGSSLLSKAMDVTLMSTKLIFLLIGIILYLQVTFHLSNIMRNKNTYVLFKFICQYEVIM